MNQRIKLLLLIPHLGGGGAERVVAELVMRLDPESFEIHLGLITQDGPGSQLPPPWVIVHRLHVRRVRHSWLKLIQLIRRQKPDVLFSGMAHLNFLVLLLRPLLPRTMRIVIRQNATASTSIRTSLARFLYSRLYPRADAIVCQSQAMAEDLSGTFAITHDKLAVLPNPIDVGAIRRAVQEAVGPTPRNLQLDSFRLLTVARLSQEKGIDLLLQALALLKQHHSGITLFLLGVGAQEAALRRQCAELDLDSQVAFCGYADPIPYYARTDLFVLPSRHEGMPNALLEAAAAGMPIVTTPSSKGLQDLLHNQPGTWIASAVSAEALADAISSALHSLRDASRRFDHAFLAPFAAETAAAAYAKFLQQQAAKRQR